MKSPCVRRGGFAAVWLLALPSAPLAASDLARDEMVVFFNTTGHLDEDRRQWVLPVHGWVFEPDENSKVKAAALAALRRMLDLEPAAEEMPVFEQRAWPFVVDNERGKELSVRIGSHVFILPESESNGHIYATLRLGVADADALAQGREPEGRWIKFSVVTGDDDRDLTGLVRLVGQKGLSVISDIDDTIKITQVADRKAVMTNTFLRTFEAVPGMAEVYRDWAEAGAAFHYVSASPWQLYAPLTEFQSRSGLPNGSFGLQLFRWKDKTAFNLFKEPDSLKRPPIEAILAEFPRRRFILVGDSGQHDPELYADLYREHPRQIARIYIRNVTRERPDGKRFESAFVNVPADRWCLFDVPAEMERDELPEP
jgi:hypothetical protein